MVRKASEKIRYQLYPDEKPKSKLQKLKERIRAKFQKPKVEEEKEEGVDPPNSSAAEDEDAIQEATNKETRTTEE